MVGAADVLDAQASFVAIQCEKAPHIASNFGFSSESSTPLPRVGLYVQGRRGMWLPADWNLADAGTNAIVAFWARCVEETRCESLHWMDEALTGSGANPLCFVTGTRSRVLMGLKVDNDNAALFLSKMSSIVPLMYFLHHILSTSRYLRFN